MLSIIWMLFVAWFLNLFGLGNTIMRGIVELGGPEISLMGYYFIFAAAGLLKNILKSICHTKADDIKELLGKD